MTLTWETLGNIRIAAQLYDVGGGTVDSLTVDWQLSDDERAELLALVKAGWAAGRWAERRVAGRDRRAD